MLQNRTEQKYKIQILIIILIQYERCLASARNLSKWTCSDLKNIPFTLILLNVFALPTSMYLTSASICSAKRSMFANFFDIDRRVFDFLFFLPFSEVEGNWQATRSKLTRNVCPGCNRGFPGVFYLQKTLQKTPKRALNLGANTLKKFK